MAEWMNQKLVSALADARRSSASEEGQTAVEYVLILATVSIGVTTAVLFLKGKLDDVISTIAQAI